MNGKAISFQQINAMPLMAARNKSHLGAVGDQRIAKRAAANDMANTNAGGGIHTNHHLHGLINLPGQHEGLGGLNPNSRPSPAGQVLDALQ